MNPLDIANAEIERFNDAQETFAGQYTDLHTKLAEANAEIERLQTKASNLKASLDSFQQEAKSLRAERDSLKERYYDVRDRRDGFIRANEKLQADNDRLKEAVKAAQTLVFEALKLYGPNGVILSPADGSQLTGASNVCETYLTGAFNSLTDALDPSSDGFTKGGGCDG